MIRKLFLVDLLPRVFSTIPLSSMDQIMRKSRLVRKVLPGNLIFNTNSKICTKTSQEHPAWHTKIFSGMTCKQSTSSFGWEQLVFPTSVNFGERSTQTLRKDNTRWRSTTITKWSPSKARRHLYYQPLTHLVERTTSWLCATSSSAPCACSSHSSSVLLIWEREIKAAHNKCELNFIILFENLQTLLFFIYAIQKKWKCVDFGQDK